MRKIILLIISTALWILAFYLIGDVRLGWGVFFAIFANNLSLAMKDVKS